jgi:hypothetical protein
LNDATNIDFCGERSGKGNLSDSELISERVEVIERKRDGRIGTEI